MFLLNHPSWRLRHFLSLLATTIIIVGGLIGLVACQDPPPDSSADDPVAKPANNTSDDAASTATPAHSSNVPAKATAACASSSLPAGDSIRTIATPDGRTRTYHVHVPANVSSDPAKPPSLVLAFHGGGHTATIFDSFAHLRTKSDASGYVLVLPEGIGAIGSLADNRLETWNAGSCCSESVADKVDDVGFVGMMLDALEKETCFDTNRVFSTGFSNGGMLSYRLACAMSDRIAAIAPVSGGLGDENFDTTPVSKIFDCTPTRAVPVLHFHGTQDACYPFAGGASPLNTKLPGIPEEVTGGFQPVAQTIATFVNLEKCTQATTTTFSKGNVTCTAYDCPSPGHVELCKIDGGGHQWPGGDPWPGAGFLCGRDNGPVTQDIIANDAIWQFFEAHPLARM